MIEFPFIDFETENLGKILKPFVFVELSNNGISLSEYPMLIDSGADVTLIPKKTGKRLELRIPEDDKISNLRLRFFCHKATKSLRIAKDNLHSHPVRIKKTLCVFVPSWQNFF